MPLPQSQQAEDYPQDMAGRIAIAADAPLGVRRCRAWTSQGAAPSVQFVVGDLPEIVEHEVDGEAPPVLVRPPVTTNGRIFPRENVDAWTVEAKQGDTYTCLVSAAQLGSPLDAHLEVYDAANRLLAESDDGRRRRSRCSASPRPSTAASTRSASATPAGAAARRSSIGSRSRWARSSIASFRWAAGAGPR